MHGERQARLAGLGVTVILLVGLLWLLPQLELFQHYVLCTPSAFLTSVFFGMPMKVMPDRILVIMQYTITVTNDCSAAKFMALLLALVAGLATEQRWPLNRVFLMLPGLYIVVIMANAARIISTWYVDQLAAACLPAFLEAGAHAMTGFIIFLTVLSLIYFCLWRTYYEYK